MYGVARKEIKLQGFFSSFEKLQFGFATNTIKIFFYPFVWKTQFFFLEILINIAILMEASIISLFIR